MRIPKSRSDNAMIAGDTLRAGRHRDIRADCGDSPILNDDRPALNRSSIGRDVNLRVLDHECALGHVVWRMRIAQRPEANDVKSADNQHQQYSENNGQAPRETSHQTTSSTGYDP
jgi:hypothetical protein